MGRDKTMILKIRHEKNHGLHIEKQYLLYGHRDHKYHMFKAFPSFAEAPELPPRLYNEPERTSVQHQHSEDTQVESLSWTPLENNHNDSTTSDSNTEPEMSSPQTGHVTPDPPSHIDPVSCMSSPTNPDMVISGQVNFISDGSSMDNEDFDDFICDIYEGHPEVMDDLKRKYEVR